MFIKKSNARNPNSFLLSVFCFSSCTNEYMDESLLYALYCDTLIVDISVFTIHVAAC